MTIKRIVTIDKEIYNYIPGFNVIAYNVSFLKLDNEKIKEELFKQKIDVNTDVLNIPKIKEVRDIYKRMGVDPSHTRCAQESLIRRCIKRTLTSIEPVVDLGNILSIKAIRSVCVVDIDKIDDIYITIGKKGERIDAINRDSINMENIICYKDSSGIFGSTTSDSKRTMVTSNTSNYLIMVILFTKEENEEQILLDLLNEYSQIKNIERINQEVK